MFSHTLSIFNINNTSMCSPKIPDSTLIFSLLILSLKSSYKCFTCSGLADSIKLSRFPFLVSANKVKCVYLGTRMHHFKHFI